MFGREYSQGQYSAISQRVNFSLIRRIILTILTFLGHDYCNIRFQNILHDCKYLLMESLAFNLISWKYKEMASTKLAEKCQVKTTVAYHQVELRLF